MTTQNALKQGEQTLKERIEHKQDNRTTDVKLLDELYSKVYEFGDLMAERHALINRVLVNQTNYFVTIKATLESYRKAIKK